MAYDPNNSIAAILAQFDVRLSAAESGTPTPGPTLTALLLSSTSFLTGGATSVGITGKTSGSTIAATSSDGTAVSVSGSTLTGTFTTAGTPNITLTETLTGATNSGRQSVIGVSVAAPTPTPGTLSSPTLFIGGASLEQFSDTGESTSRFGHSPSGLLNWANMTGFTRLFDVVVRRNTASPYYDTPSNFASSGAGFTVAGRRVSITDQVPQLIAAMQAVPVGKRACYFSAGRNDLADGMTSSQYMALFEPLVDQLLAVADLLIIPGLTKRAVSTGGTWAAGGSARTATDEINVLLASMVQRKGAKAVFIPLQDIACEATGNQDPKTGYTYEGIHTAPLGAQAGGVRARSVLLPYFTPIPYPVLATNFAPPLTGTGGTFVTGATGVVATGYVGTKTDANMTVVFSQPETGVQRMAVTSAVTQVKAVSGGQLSVATINAVVGAVYRTRCRVRVAPTSKLISLSMYMSELTSGLTQRAVGLWHMAGGTAPDVTVANIGADSVGLYTVPAEGLELWLESPDLIIRGTSGTPTMAINLQLGIPQGSVDTVVVDVIDWQVERIS